MDNQVNIKFCINKMKQLLKYDPTVFLYYKLYCRDGFNSIMIFMSILSKLTLKILTFV